MTAYTAKWQAIRPAHINLLEIPEDAIGVTVTPALDHSDSLIVAWLIPAFSLPEPHEEEA